MIDTEGYELKRLPWWYSPKTKKPVNFDTYSMLSYWREMTETDIKAFLRKRGFRGEEYLTLEGEFDRGELEERVGIFRVNTKKPVIIRRYIRRRYIPEVLTVYSIMEKLELLKIYLTFSIETGAGHEPFFAEVTCDTVMPPNLKDSEMRDRVRRVVNGVLKLFFIVFDGNKLVRTEKREKDPDWLIRTLMYLQRYANPVYEGTDPRRTEQRGGMDGFIDMMMSRINMRSFDEFVTRESVITIGIEYESTTDTTYEYPYIHASIEKVRERRWHQERIVVLSPSTDIWLDEMLDMVVSW